MNEYYLKESLNLSFTSSFDDINSNDDFVFIALPTNFNENTQKFDSSIIENSLRDLSDINFKGQVVIKSTISIGFTQSMLLKFPNLDIVFSPEFLREGQALYDNLYPSRVVIGSDHEAVNELMETLKKAILNKDVEIIHTSSKEAEAIKLLSNTYLAMRVAFFNEVDTFSVMNKLSAKNIIKGLSLDPRIGDYYNNPSFGYGGYCLPKDTKQMLSNFQDIPQNLISAIINSNETRKRFIADQIINENPKVVGVYRLIMKMGSDNFRESAIFDVMKTLENHGIRVVIFEPELKDNHFEFHNVICDLELFKKESDIIIANRLEDTISDVKDKVYTRDIFNNN
jgi:UDPglucose 6-dehydrogenase